MTSSTWIVKILVALLVLAAGLAAAVFAYLQHPKFGRLPEGERLARIAASPHGADGAFRNLVPTPILTNDASFLSVLIENNFGEKTARLKPRAPLPTVKTDLKGLNPATDVVVWLGHSSYYLQLGGKRILVDPVFSDNAAPVPFANTAFAGTALYAADDMPEIDYLLISHDHWDHLDYPTITALTPKVGKVVSGLGIGADFDRWGYPAEKIFEADWNQDLDFDDGLTIHVLPARHYSGRLLTKNRTLWVGFALEAGGRRVFLSGDSGYGPHFAEIGRRFDGFDLAILDAGQYDRRWANIHMFPEEAARAAEELGARALLPAHIGKFAIANHPWDEPFARVAKASEGKPYDLVIPKIGEAVALGAPRDASGQWWKGLD